MIFKILAAILAISFGFLGMVAIVIEQTGLLIVDVQDKRTEERLFLPVPMLLVNLAANVLPATPLQQIHHQLGSRQKLLKAACEELTGCPDGSFVEIRSPSRTVYIVKHGDNLLIDANSPTEKVHVRIPITAAGKAVTRIANAGSI